MIEMEVHPLALTYPPMSAEEMAALVADIKARGLRRPIVRYEGKILDGRNRYQACRRAGVEPAFVDYQGDDPLGEVNSQNLSRDLTPAQRAFVAARQWLLNGDTRDRGKGRRGGADELLTATHSVKVLAKQFRVGNNSIAQARDLLRAAPDLADAVSCGGLSLAEAARNLKDRQEQAAKEAAEAARLARYREAIDRGEMTIEEALRRVAAAEREAAEKLRSETDARHTWLARLASVLEWVEAFVGGMTPGRFSWHFAPGAPGTFDHGITAERLRAAAAELRRIEALLKGDDDGEPSGVTAGPGGARRLEAEAPAAAAAEEG
jgi:hypothetical protein